MNKKKFETNFFQSEHTSSQIWCFLKFPLCWGGGPKIKVDQNGMKHGLVLEFLRSDEIFKMGGGGGVKESKLLRMA